MISHWAGWRNHSRLAPQNVHFGDELKDGVLIFDYRMKPGVVHKSNALELMRAVGIEMDQ
jgi:DNA mismatch repair ATPase MutS